MQIISNILSFMRYLFNFHRMFKFLRKLSIRIQLKATFRSALDRMKEFPEFIFTCACAAYYKWVEENAPEMFEEIKERIKEGRWVVAGGWWIQPDCNIPSGESYVRHGLYSQRYFQDKFGLMAKVGYNVDSFGHNSMLPQILKKSGMDYYVFMHPGEHEKNLPYNLFRWESEDGSIITAFKLPFAYNHGYEGFEDDLDDLKGVKRKFNATFLLRRKFAGHLKLSERRGVDYMGFYGVGNHGGGPTIKNLELIRELQKEWGAETIFHSSPDQYFTEMAAKNPDIPTIKDDLQMHAVGCYSAHSESKADNRRAEHNLTTSEKFASMANILLGLEYPKDKIRKAWQNVMFNQFHDIMGGCSIKEAFRDVRESYGEALNISAEVQNNALQKISWAIDTMGDETVCPDKENDWRVWESGDRGVPLVVFNPLSWQVSAPIQVNKPVAGITDDMGNPIALQTVRSSRTNKNDKWDKLFIGSVPAMGYRVFRIFPNKEFEETEKEYGLSAGEDFMENDFIRLEFEKHTGFIKRLFDRRNHVEIIAGNGAAPVVMDENHCDTWAHGVQAFDREIGRFADASIRVLENGPIRARVGVTSSYNTSLLQQEFFIYYDRPEIEVRVKLDWREKHKLLKLSFPVNVEQPSAVYEIPYGFLNRPVNGDEYPGQQWLDVSGETKDESGKSCGLAIANDAKYSYDVRGNDLRLTVVRSPLYADHFGVRDEYCEFMDHGVQEFKYLLMPHMGGWKQSGAAKKAYELNVPPIQVVETYHKGPLPLMQQGIAISADNIMATVFKEAEDGDGHILRCYETNGVDTAADIEIAVLGRKWSASFGRCEIKTFRIPEDEGREVVEKNLIEM